MATAIEENVGSFTGEAEEDNEEFHKCCECPSKAEWMGILNSHCPHDGKSAYACGPHAEEWQHYEKEYSGKGYRQHCLECNSYPVSVTWKKL